MARRDPLDPLGLDDPDAVHSAMREAVTQCCVWLLVLVAMIVCAVLLTLHLLSTH